MPLVIAHASHWLVNLVYFAPVVIVVGALALQARRDARRRRLGPDVADDVDDD